MKRVFTAITMLLAFTAGAFAQQDRHRALEGAYAEVLAAEQALHDAEARRTQGIEPLEGERLGIVSAKGRPPRSRLGPEYFERQRALDREVERARTRLERAYQRWNEAR